MSLLHHSQAKLADERGAMLVMFAVFAPVAVLFLAFVVDVGNSFWHARHLQLQADAGALAVSEEFQPCFDGGPAAEEANAGMYAHAAQYAGAEEATTPSEPGPIKAALPLYNLQIGKTSQEHIHAELNSKLYFEQPTPVDSSAVEKAPCEADMMDVKLTETDLPWYVKVLKSGFNGIPNIDAHARVEILQETSATGLEPLAVAETAPVAARAYFLNEDNNNEVLGSVSLTKTGVNAQGQDVWSNATAPLALAINKTNAATAHIGVKVALSGNAGHTKCGEAYVQCFDETGGPLLHVAGYSLEGKGTFTAPLARRVTLSNPAPNICTDGYYSNTTASCTFTISAKVDYGSANTTGVTVTPEIKGAKGSALTYEKATGEWVGTGTLPAASGSNEINLIVECNPKAKESACPSESKKTSATIKDVHRIYAANYEHNSGTIAGAFISEVGGLPQDANSFEVCETADSNKCTHELVVTLDVGGSLGDAQSYYDPIRNLRWEGEQGVRAGCPPPAKPSGSEYREKLESGCEGTYTVNTRDPECVTNESPYECVTVGLPGKDTGPTQQGIDERMENHPGTRFYCENNWQNNNGGAVPVLPADDSRIVELFVIPYGTINDEGISTLGREEVPIQDFATFYVTWFAGDRCKADERLPEVAKLLKEQKGPVNAEIVGHFIKYVNPLGRGGENKCTGSLGECVAVLTR
jgi:Putative Flp pilus-assembly TadE/G-like